MALRSSCVLDDCEYYTSSMRAFLAYELCAKTFTVVGQTGDRDAACGLGSPYTLLYRACVV